MKKLPGIFFALTLAIQAGPKKIMVIGDSQSEEYRFEIPFSAPESNPIESNTKNWIELLSEHRPDDVTFGEYKRNAFEWFDVRNAGYQYNWSIPGAFTATFLEVLNSSIFNDEEYFLSKLELLDQIDEVDAVVIFLGGNDIRTVYSKLHRDEPPAGWPQSLVDEMAEIIEIVQDEDSSVRIIVGDFPDVGGTEKTKLSHPDQRGRKIASQHVAHANQLLKQMLDTRNIPLFEVSRVTTDLLGDEPIRIGNVQFLPFGHPENPPRNLLCRDGFHPATSTQARIANMIVSALNDEAGWAVTPFTDQEILTAILGLDPTIDDDYLAWIGNFAVNNNSLLADLDGDGLENLGEYALNKNPLVPDMPQLIPDRTFDFTLAPLRKAYVKTTPAVSPDLEKWTPFDAPPPFTIPEPFFRLEFHLLDNEN